MRQRIFLPVGADACAVLGQFAALLAEGRPLPDALRLLSSGLALRSVVVRSATGDVLGVGGEALQAVGGVDREDVWLEFPVSGPDGSLATLTVRGGRPTQLPTLRAAASVLALALAGRPEHTASALSDDAEDCWSELADALHDGPLQSLMVARYAVDAAVRGGDPGAVRESIQQAVIELRQLVWSLRPRGSNGLREALEQLAAKATGLPLEVRLGDHDPTGPEAVLAYRVVQTMHAHATEAVRVRLDGRTLEISGAALPSASRWVRRAASAGCQLTIKGAITTLVLTPDPLRSVPVDVRTTP